MIPALASPASFSNFLTSTAAAHSYRPSPISATNCHSNHPQCRRAQPSPIATIKAINLITTRAPMLIIIKRLDQFDHNDNIIDIFLNLVVCGPNFLSPQPSSAASAQDNRPHCHHTQPILTAVNHIINRKH